MRIRLTLTATAIVLICVAVGIAGYLASQPSGPPPRPGDTVHIDIGKFRPVSPPLPAPALTYTGRDGTENRLADLEGHWVLVNLWATWCAPCVKEMPTLDRLQDKMRSTLTIVAISEDRNGGKAVDPFLAAHPFKSLAIGLDPAGHFTDALHIDGLPTSLLIDPRGHIIAKLEGGAEWDQGLVFDTLKILMR